ncbi:nitroreductase family deazaflavin-dependent oxidoreductase [Mycolicibacterium bacteremicum]|uniref:Nitroreductase family deazaflavin-dependent oxidoreductase n=1 Tax=Mycolicibacterium bacteremicum TaxID=564198 RepID=A0A1W9Z2K0_MYCBA|nr:nitroreductase family deazaflavin-dependent oxidoreductase [Mycolicibacterium bacteremicum]MCV7432047.1 nitroreductase family deazaflavin-dependent oxidoreductase [Mycolicibacterium bacteremicum]ORA06525.1 nitroreductase family deazaflavin-dependent oxidoreductase [Mycolicibacterium bacteremicum]
MLLARRRAEFNRRFVNPVVEPLAGYLPLWSAVDHVGRRSGREYRTPVTAFATSDGVAVLLPYGTDTDWVRNLRAAGSGKVVIDGRSLLVENPRVVPVREALEVMRGPWRHVLRVAPVESALLLTRSS